MKTSIGVNGACGRMGQRIVQLAQEDKSLHLAVALESAGHPQLGKDIGEVAGIGPLGVQITSTMKPGQHVEAMIDFSMPSGTMAVLQTCIDSRLPLVVATTGHTAEQKKQIEAAAHHTAILIAPNMSLVVNVLFKLVREAATVLKDKGFDVEIIERHHRFKADSPSGTALHFARIIQEAMGDMPLAPWPGRPGRATAAARDRHARRPGRGQRRRTHDHLQHARRNDGIGPQRPHPRRLRSRSPASRQVPGRQRTGTIHHGRRAWFVTVPRLRLSAR